MHPLTATFCGHYLTVICLEQKGIAPQQFRPIVFVRWLDKSIEPFSKSRLGDPLILTACHNSKALSK